MIPEWSTVGQDAGGIPVNGGDWLFYCALLALLVLTAGVVWRWWK